MRITATPRPSRAGLILADWLTLSAIVVVVLVVSLPRLHCLALHQNERDAMQALRLFGGNLHAMERDLTLPTLLEENGELEHRLDDIETLEDGRLLRRHGYLFDLTRDENGAPQIRAWPWSSGETGLGAFIYTADGLQGHPNGEGHWSGPEAAPVWTPSDSNWRRVER